MATYPMKAGLRAGIKAGNVLCVTDLSQEAEQSLEWAHLAADKRGVNLELIHVVDLSRARSMPDAQMGVQFILESLARKLQLAKDTVTATLLFGSPDRAIAKRANDGNASLIVFAAGGEPSAISRQMMMTRIRSLVTCPVIDLSCPKPCQRHVIRKLVLLPSRVSPQGGKSSS